MSATWISFLLLSILSINVSAQPFPPPHLCNPDDSWKTVDTVQSVNGNSALLAGMTSYKNFAYAVGEADLGGRIPGNWIIRRSIDYGDTWSTVRVLLGGGRGIAVDPRNGHLYSIGSIYHPETDSDHRWIVQKSTDNGHTWTIVDDFYDEDRFINSDRITVDGKGNVMIVGEDNFQGRDGSVIRRSEDGGTTWTTIRYVSGPFLASQIAASVDGQVIIVGGLRFGDPNIIGNKWAVMHSPDGKSNWRQVDLLGGSLTDPAVGAFAFGVSIRNTGKVVVTGNIGKDFAGPFRMVVREAHLSYITKWTTVMNYQPFDRRLGAGSATAAHVTFVTNQRYVINGRQRAPRSTIEENIALDKRFPIAERVSDKIMNPFASPFQNELIFNGGLTRLSNGLLLSGYIQDNDTSKSWFIRKMTCPL